MLSPKYSRDQAQRDPERSAPGGSTRAYLSVIREFSGQFPGDSTIAFPDQPGAERAFSWSAALRGAYPLKMFVGFSLLLHLAVLGSALYLANASPEMGNAPGVIVISLGGFPGHPSDWGDGQNAGDAGGGPSGDQAGGAESLSEEPVETAPKPPGSLPNQQEKPLPIAEKAVSPSSTARKDKKPGKTKRTRIPAPVAAVKPDRSDGSSSAPAPGSAVGGHHGSGSGAVAGTGQGAGSGDGGSGGGAGLGSGSGTGSGGGGQGGGSAGYLKGNYGYIQKRIRKYLVYSPQAKRMGIEGTVTLSFVIDKKGQARGISVRTSSGYDFLDESAVAAVMEASPFPPPPEPARIVIPIIFGLK